MSRKFILSLLLACATVCCLTACSPAGDNSDNNDNKIPPITDAPKTEYEIEIKSTFAEKYGLDVSETELVKCETRDGIYAVYACGDETALSYETIGAITYIFPNTPHYMEICYFGKFYTASTAYYSGLLSYDDWFNIAEKRGKDWYRLDEEKWAEIKCKGNEIKSAFARMHKINADTVWFTGYGEYNGAYPIMITAEEFGYSAAITYDNVGGVILTYPSGQKMDVYYDGKFYSLSAAYENGLLTNSDLIEIAKRYGGYYITEQEQADIIAAYRENNAGVIADDTEIIISSHYGTVGEYYAVSVGVKGTTPYFGKTEEITADGELFGKEHHSVEKIEYINFFGISLYKDGSLYTLKYAVENKLLSLDDFIKLSERNSFYFSN